MLLASISSLTTVMASTEKTPHGRTIFTVGHSNRSLDDFLTLLATHAIDEIVDIRAIPYSGYNPQFNRESLAPALERVGIEYRHDQTLAGTPPDRDTMERATRCSDRSRGYWEQTKSPAFRSALASLLERVTPPETHRIALMCGEAQPEHCHRYQTSHLLEQGGCFVEHIIDAGPPRPHQPQLF